MKNLQEFVNNEVTALVAQYDPIKRFLMQPTVKVVRGPISTEGLIANYIPLVITNLEDDMISQSIIVGLTTLFTSLSEEITAGKYESTGKTIWLLGDLVKIKPKFRQLKNGMYENVLALELKVM